MRKDRSEYNEYMKGYMRERYRSRRNAAIIDMGGKCAKCSASEGLEVDHIDYTLKTCSISKMWSLSETAYKLELKKCQLLCSACHLKKTMAEGSLKDRECIKVCKCGETLLSIKSYAGHVRWCSTNLVH